MKEDQEAPVTAGALSVTGVHRHPLEAGSEMEHLMREAHKRGVAHHHGTVDLIIVLVLLEERAEVQLMMLKEIRGIKGIEALLKKMATAVVLAPSEERTGVLLMTMTITMVLLEAVNQLKRLFDLPLKAAVNQLKILFDLPLNFGKHINVQVCRQIFTHFVC
jgi:uncharacterized membrane protein YhfC